MGSMKFKAGDRVRIKSLDWYNENKNNKGIIVCGSESFKHPMSYFCNKVVSIITIQDNCYRILEDDGDWYWTDEMIEGLVEEETVHNKWTGLKVELELSKTVIGVSNVESLRGERFMSGFVKAIIPPEGYIFKDENGNVINATKIVLEKKKKEYPKTYEECCKVMGVNHTNDLDICEHCDYKTEITYYEDSLLEKIEALYRLIICRDAYWKIAGEDMGLGKPWEPDFTNDDEERYGIYTAANKVVKDFCGVGDVNTILTFPTEEMRDVFYENFKSEIKSCKEFL